MSEIFFKEIIHTKKENRILIKQNYVPQATGAIFWFSIQFSNRKVSRTNQILRERKGFPKMKHLKKD